MVQKPEMQPILVDGSELAAQDLVEVIDDFWIALHDNSDSKTKPGLVVV
jgi:hypothetical protein